MPRKKPLTVRKKVEFQKLKLPKHNFDSAEVSDAANSCGFSRVGKSYVILSTTGWYKSFSQLEEEI